MHRPLHRASVTAAKSFSAVRAFNPNALAWVVLCVAALVIHLMMPITPWLGKFPGEWVLPLADWINIAMESFVQAVKPVNRAISAMLEWPMILLRDVLTWLSWPITVAGVVLLSWPAVGNNMLVGHALYRTFSLLESFNEYHGAGRHCCTPDACTWTGDRCCSRQHKLGQPNLRF